MLNFSYPCLLSLVEIIEGYFSFTPLSSWLHGCSVEWFCVDSPRTDVFADIWVAGRATLEHVWGPGPGPGPGGAWAALQPWGAWSAGPSPGRAECGSLRPVCSCFCTFLHVRGVRCHHHGQCMCAPLFASPQSWLFPRDTTNAAARGPCCRQRGPGAVLCCQHLYFKAAWGRRHYLNKTLGRFLPFLLQDVIF